MDHYECDCSYSLVTILSYQMMGGMGMMGGGGAQPGFDAKSAYQQEREALSAVRYDSDLDRVERRLLGERYPDPSVPAIDLAK